MKQIKKIIAIGMLPVWLVGCATSSTYVDPNGQRTVVNVGKINIQDFSTAADAFIQTILGKLAEGQLQSSEPGEPAVMAISRISNNTTAHLDTDQLVKKMRIELNRSGKILTTTTLAYGGVEDPLAKETQEYLAMTGRGSGQRLPDYTLTGKILEDYARDGRTRQVSYIFQMSLTDRAGLAIWEDEKIITKQGKSGAVGW